MLQIDHVYEFLSSAFIKNAKIYTLPNGVPSSTPPEQYSLPDVHSYNTHIFNKNPYCKKIFFYDQEPFLRKFASPSLLYLNNKQYHAPDAIVTSEHSIDVTNFCSEFNIYNCYYFFHGFAALDWYRGYYTLNYDKTVIRPYKYSFISMNRIINDDRSYRIYWVSKLAELGLLDQGKVSFNVTDNLFDDWRDEVVSPNTKLSEYAKSHAEQYLTNINKLVIDSAELPGSASADIPRGVDALWNVVTETVFYYDKLHLTEKIFKPIVSKQPFMLLAAPGNLEYLRSYGFKTFDGIIDESYDLIQDNDARVDAVAAQLHWYCTLSAEEKQTVIERLAPIVEYNFHHFYGEFKHIITQELLDNCKALFKEIGYDDSTIAYNDIYKVLTN